MAQCANFDSLGVPFDEAAANAALIVKAVNNFSRMEQMLKDCLCVMNASAVGFKTQEAVEKLLSEIK